MRVGSIVYATDQGLGILAKSFYDAGVVTDVVVLAHGKHPTHTEWYPNAPMVTILHDKEQQTLMRDFCDSMDVMLFFETPFHWLLINHCRKCDTKTVLMPMHECYHNIGDRPDNWFDLYLCSSYLDLQCFQYHKGHAKVEYLPVPVQVPWRLRTEAEVFVHNAGHGGLMGRNGTAELLEAIPMLKSDARIIVRSQRPFEDKISSSLQRVDFVHGTQDYGTLWDKGDVFVFPEKFNGLSLPLQEARAAGMLVMCGDRFPMNMWLPHEPLIPVNGYKHGQRVGPPYNPFDEAVFDPQVIAAKIDEWYGRDITDYSLGGREWAQQMSWQVLKPQYMRVLEELL